MAPPPASPEGAPGAGRPRAAEPGSEDRGRRRRRGEPETGEQEEHASGRRSGRPEGPPRGAGGEVGVSTARRPRRRALAIPVPSRQGHLSDAQAHRTGPLGFLAAHPRLPLPALWPRRPPRVGLGAVDTEPPRHLTRAAEGAGPAATSSLSGPTLSAGARPTPATFHAQTSTVGPDTSE